jgi:hypothetical protein
MNNIIKKNAYLCARFTQPLARKEWLVNVAFGYKLLKANKLWI